MSATRKNSKSRTKNYINKTNSASQEKWQLFTDVDDTLHPAGPGFIGWMAGSNYTGSRHEYYDCVGDLHKQFYKRYGLPTVIVSANPLPVTRSKTTNVKKNLGNIDVKIFKGEPLASATSVVRSSYQEMANIKIKQIREEVTNQRLINGHSRYKAIWIGDNGQGDLLVAQQLLKDNIIQYALIHTVDKEKPDGSRMDKKQKRIIKFRKNTYDWLINHLKTHKKFDGKFEWLKECSSEKTSLNTRSKSRSKSRTKSRSTGGCLRSVSRSRNRTRRRR